MICVHRLNGEALFVSAAHILTVEATPDTVLHLLDGSRLRVREPVSDVCASVTRWFQEVGRITVLPPPKSPEGDDNAAGET